MMYKLLIIAVAFGVIAAAVGGGLYLAYPVQVSTLGGLTRNYLVSWSAPPGTITTESNAGYKAWPAASTVRQDQGLEFGQSLRKGAESA
jgi:hypothetical protein